MSEETIEKMEQPAAIVAGSFPKFFIKEGNEFESYSWDEGCQLINATLDALWPLFPGQEKVGKYSFRGEWFEMQSQVKLAIGYIELFSRGFWQQYQTHGNGD